MSTSSYMAFNLMVVILFMFNCNLVLSALGMSLIKEGCLRFMQHGKDFRGIIDYSFLDPTRPIVDSGIC